MYIIATYSNEEEKKELDYISRVVYTGIKFRDLKIKSD